MRSVNVLGVDAGKANAKLEDGMSWHDKVGTRVRTVRQRVFPEKSPENTVNLRLAVIALALLANAHLQHLMFSNKLKLYHLACCLMSPSHLGIYVGT